MYELNLHNFTGPLDALLNLIEERKLEINEISLAEVTDAFLKHLEGLQDTSFALLADFIEVASRLILIKSRSLLPDLALTGEEETNIKDLEARLKLYKELRAGGKHIAKNWHGSPQEMTRPYLFGLGDSAGVFYPGTNLTPEGLVGSLQNIVETLERYAMEHVPIKEKIISLEEKIREIIARVKEMGETSLTKLSSDKSRAEIVAIFLALLHLARDQFVFLEQEGHFSDIIVRGKKT
ncbi:MAG: segregation/condensation protein A [bacterium]|nr:segregation/condensation protein A [bacterium]